MTNHTRVVIDVDRDGWTKQLQLNVARLDERGTGHGYRLAGPKYNGSSRNLLRVELTERDAAEIRRMLDAVFPARSDATEAAGREQDRCQRCLRDFDPSDTRFDGRARHKDTPWCRMCVDNCHDGGAEHVCCICDPARYGGEAR